MKTEMTFKNYQELAERTINTNLTENKKLAHALYGLSSETGEITFIDETHKNLALLNKYFKEDEPND